MAHAPVIYYKTYNTLIDAAYSKNGFFSALFIDIDHDETINDMPCHSAGDEVPAEVATAWVCIGMQYERRGFGGQD